MHLFKEVFRLLLAWGMGLKATQTAKTRGHCLTRLTHLALWLALQCAPNIAEINKCIKCGGEREGEICGWSFPRNAAIYKEVHNHTQQTVSVHTD